MYKSIACIAACILCVAGCAQSPAIPPPTACTAGAPLDLARYMGRWYVIADTPFLSEHDYVGNYDEFTLLADGKIDDRYLGRRHDFGQPVTGSHFVAKVIPGTGNTKWRVGLIWPFEIVVITAYVDPEYRYTIRDMADGNMVWVLARDPQMDEGAYRDVLARLAAMRSFMRDINLGREPDVTIPAAVGLSPEDVQDMHRLLALAKNDERYVIPPAHPEIGDTDAQAHQLEEQACSLDYDGGPGMGGSGPFGESSGGPSPVAVENFHALRQRQTSDTFTDPADGAQRVNLLNWDGKGSTARLMPPRPEEDDA